MKSIESKFTKEELDMLNSKIGLYSLLRKDKININRVLDEVKMTFKLKSLQEDLIKLQTWVIENDKKVVILFEGRDAAGKGGAIRRITEYMNPRHFRVVALDIPSEDERKQWFFQRYISQLPNPGEIVFFDRSWYNRAIVEPVNGFCTPEEYKIFMSQVNEFEDMLIKSETHLIKFYFSITKDEQAKRFDDIKNDPLKRWKITPVDRRALELWDQYTLYKERMYKKTSTKIAPWIVIDANQKPIARIEAISQILRNIPYK